MASHSDKKSNSHKHKGPRPSGAPPRRGPHKNTNNHRRPQFRPKVEDTSPKLTTLEAEIGNLGQEILTMIIDTLNRSEIESADSLTCDRFRVRSMRYIRDGLKFSRKKETRQRNLMKELLDLRSSLPTSALVKFYENKEILVKQHQELKSYTALCEAKIRLIRIFNHLDDEITQFKKENNLQSLDFKDALPQILHTNLDKMRSLADDDEAPEKDLIDVGHTTATDQQAEPDVDEPDED